MCEHKPAAVCTGCVCEHKPLSCAQVCECTPRPRRGHCDHRRELPRPLQADPQPLLRTAAKQAPPLPAPPPLGDLELAHCPPTPLPALALCPPARLPAAKLDGPPGATGDAVSGRGRREWGAGNGGWVREGLGAQSPPPGASGGPPVQSIFAFTLSPERPARGQEDGTRPAALLPAPLPHVVALKE